MADPVKPRRRYESQRRKEQAAQTRDRILDAAQKLFAEQGYSGATIAAIARAGGAATETVYAVFSNKQTILRAAIARAVVGGDGALLDQPGPMAIDACRDQSQQIEIFAEDMTRRMERIAPLMEVLVNAAKSDPEMAVFYQSQQDARRKGLAAFVRALLANGPLQSNEEAAVETVWALSSPELYRLTTGAGRWSAEVYGGWLAQSLSRILLAQRASG